MTILDVIIIAVFLGLGLLGYLRGSIREFLALINLVIPILVVSALYSPFSFIFKIFVENVFVAKFFSLIFLFIILYILLMVVFLLLISNFPKVDINEIADGVIGSILGIIQFIIIISYLLCLLASTEDGFLMRQIKSSKMGMPFLKVNRVFFLTFEGIYKNFNDDFIKPVEKKLNLNDNK